MLSHHRPHSQSGRAPKALCQYNTLNRNKKQAKSSMAQSQIIRGGKLNANAGIESWYMGELEKLSRAMTRECARELKKLYAKEDEQIKFAEDAGISSQMRIKLNYLQKKYGDKFAKSQKSCPKSC